MGCPPCGRTGGRPSRSGRSGTPTAAARSCTSPGSIGPRGRTDPVRAHPARRTRPSGRSAAPGRVTTTVITGWSDSLRTANSRARNESRSAPCASSMTSTVGRARSSPVNACTRRRPTSTAFSSGSAEAVCTGEPYPRTPMNRKSRPITAKEELRPDSPPLDQNTRRSLWRSTNRRRRAVFPMPAGPSTSTTREPSSTTSPSTPSRASSSCCRPENNAASPCTAVSGTAGRSGCGCRIVVGRPIPPGSSDSARSHPTFRWTEGKTRVSPRRQPDRRVRRRVRCRGTVRPARRGNRPRAWRRCA